MRKFSGPKTTRSAHVWPRKKPRKKKQGASLSSFSVSLLSAAGEPLPQRANRRATKKRGGKGEDDIEFQEWIKTDDETRIEEKGRSGRNASPPLSLSYLLKFATDMENLRSSTSDLPTDQEKKEANCKLRLGNGL